MPLTADRAKETTTTTGTGTITLLGAVAQFQAIATSIPVGSSFMYAIVGQTGTEWEVGNGTLLTSSTVQRDRVRSSSNSNAFVNFSAGTKDVFATITALYAESAGLGQIHAQARGLAMP
jgi:hypothetical protein